MTSDALVAVRAAATANPSLSAADAAMRCCQCAT
jgi:hypothetical protein